ncbi:MAG: Chromate resistance protein ChrB [Chloroflexota bacterium]
MTEQTHDRWLLMIYRVPQEPPGRRTYVWRHLRQLGAVYLQQAAAILPDRAELRSGLDALRQRILEFGGDVSLLETRSPDPSWEADLLARFNSAREAEYAEVAENVERFEDEIRRERRRGRFSFAQLEDIEADWEKLQRWHERIQRRDFFGASVRAATELALTRGQAELEAFAAEVCTREGAEIGGAVLGADDRSANESPGPAD